MDWTAVGLKALDAILPVLGTLLSILALLVLKALRKKYNIEASAIQDQQVIELIKKGVNAAQEWRDQQVKSTGVRPTGSTTAEYALAVVKGLADNKTVQEYGDDMLKKLIDARVQETRNP